jgi:hypothetical protein
VFAFLSTPIDTLALSLPPPFPCSLGYNAIGVEGASALAAVLKETMIAHLECAAAPDHDRALSARVDTRLLSHCPHPHPLQSHGQWHRRRGCLCTRRRPQRDEDHAPIVRHSPEPELSLRPLSMPIDTPTLSPPPPHPSLAVSESTRSEARAPPRSPPSSRRLRSPSWGAPPPHAECSLLCQCPLTPMCSLPPGSVATALVGTTMMSMRSSPPLRESLCCVRGSRGAL